MIPRLRSLLPLLFLLGLALWFLDKPVHLDDANFVVLARAAAATPWRPHAASINWQGTTQAAFDVLSNPPGIAWFLAPVASASVVVQHAWMLLWLPLAWFGAFALGRRVADQGVAAAALIVGSPIAAWATGALTPDLPLLALSVCGMAGILGGTTGRFARRWPWALVLGCAALFRYSGLALVPLAALWPLMQGDRKGAAILGLAAAAPGAALVVHDLLAYGQVHLLAMVGFQSVSNGDRELFRKFAASVATLGGAGVLPLLVWRRGVALGLAAGLLLGVAAAAISGHHGPAWWTTVFACAAGGASLGACARARDRLDLFLGIWLVLGIVFLLTLRFSAARYWLPFLAPAVLLPLRSARVWAPRIAVPLTLGLSALLLIDDRHLAEAQAKLVARVLTASKGETGLFAGHWGWQHALEEAGWRAIEDDAAVPPGTLFARSQDAWPQSAASGCFVPVATWAEPDLWPGPRVHTAAGAANLHAFSVAGEPPVETYAPWTFSDDALDVVTLVRACP